MASRARIARGRKTQRILATPFDPETGEVGYFNEHGWPSAESVWGSQPGRDILGMPGLAPEVKATSDEPILAALRQAASNAKGDLPFVVWRPNGYGPERVGQWVMAFTVDDGIALLRAAGYGEPPILVGPDL